MTSTNRHEVACDTLWQALENEQAEYHETYGALSWDGLIEWLTEKEKAAMDALAEQETAQ